MDLIKGTPIYGNCLYPAVGCFISVPTWAPQWLSLSTSIALAFPANSIMPNASSLTVPISKRVYAMFDFTDKMCQNMLDRWTWEERPLAQVFLLVPFVWPVPWTPMATPVKSPVQKKHKGDDSPKDKDLQITAVTHAPAEQPITLKALENMLDQKLVSPFASISATNPLRSQCLQGFSAKGVCQHRFSGGSNWRTGCYYHV